MTNQLCALYYFIFLAQNCLYCSRVLFEHPGNDMQDACHEPPMNACDKIHKKVRDQLWK
jgi:hypothetical protein